MSDILKHGTYTAYARKKCRCLECRTYQNDRVAKNRADRLASGRLSHGTRSAYDAGCRCKSCRGARAKAHAGEAGHNHITRDIKMRYGECPACDDYLAGVYQ